MLQFGAEYFFLKKDDEWEEVEEEEELSYEAKMPSKHLEDDGQTCLLDIIDTAGQEEYSVLRDTTMKIGNGFLIVFDITDSSSFEEAKHIYSWLLKLRDVEHIPALLVGNKSDLGHGRQVKLDDILSFSHHANVPYIETSAKTGHNVTEAFHQIVRLIPRTGIDYTIPVLGAGGVGKSAITLRFTTNAFADCYDPTIEDSYRKLITVTGLTRADSVHKKGGRTSSERTWKKLKRLFSRKHSLPEEKKTTNAEKECSLTKKSKIVNVKKADANVLALTLGNLKQSMPLVSGDPMYCHECSAVLSHISKLDNNGDKLVWNCEFCGFANTLVDFDENAVPKIAVAEYLISPAMEHNSYDQNKGTVVYCIDVSGSMSEEEKVPELQAEWARLSAGRDPSTVKRYLSRLSCIQAAVLRQLESFEVENNQRTVALVTFESSITVYGDCIMKSLHITDDSLLYDYECLLDTGREIAKSLHMHPLSESYEKLVQTVQSLHTCGTTALGPALTICAALTSSSPGAEIILCTDGEPNCGIGKLNAHSADQDPSFYLRIGEYAKSKGVKISVIGLEGQKLSMNQVCQCADVSGGSINILHPLELIRHLRLITQNPIIATDVEVQISLHPCLSFDDVDKDNLVNSVKSTILRRELGSATRETDLTFHFNLKSGYRGQTPQELPFQVRIFYTRPEGMRCLRVISAKVYVTTDRMVMEQTSNLAILGLAATQRAAEMAIRGNFNEAKQYLQSVNRFMERNASNPHQKEEFYSFCIETQAMREQLQQCKKRGFSTTLSDSAMKTFMQKKVAYLGQYVNSTEKLEIAQSRKVDLATADLYYSYKCNELL